MLVPTAAPTTPQALVRNHTAGTSTVSAAAVDTRLSAGRPRTARKYGATRVAGVSATIPGASARRMIATSPYAGPRIHLLTRPTMGRPSATAAPITAVVPRARRWTVRAPSATPSRDSP